MRVPLVSSVVVFTATALLASACMGPQRISPPGPQWLMCEDQADTASVDTTVWGGTDHLIAFGDHSLAIPAAAIDDGDSVRFQLRQVRSRQVRAVVQSVGNYPFEADLTLTLSYEGRVNCKVLETPAPDVPTMGVYRVQPGEFLPAAPAPAEAVAGRTRTFSTFAIAS